MSAPEGAAASTALRGLEKQLVNSLWTVNNLQLTLENFESKNQRVVDSRLNDLVGGMKEINGLGEALRDIKVPVDLLRYVDEGGNPDVFAAETLKHCLAENQRSRGKVAAFRELREAMLAEVQEAFPEDCTAYLGAADRAAPPGGSASAAHEKQLPNGTGA